MTDLQQAPEQWLKNFHANFPLPPPDDIESEKIGWTILIKELQDFSLAQELKSEPDTSSFGIVVYISVFNTETGMFHGRTWKSPVITEINSSLINLMAHGILVGKESVIVIEFALQVTYFRNEKTETSLFFTVIPQPTTSIEHMCPLFSGTPRFLLSRPRDYTAGLSTRPGQLVVEFQRNDELLKAEPLLPLCTFFGKPIAGIKQFTPTSVEPFVPITISRISLDAPPDFDTALTEELKITFAEKYHMTPSSVNLKIVKKSIHVSAHNTHKFVWEMLKAELTEWKFDDRMTIRRFMNHPDFAVALQLVVTIEIDCTPITETESSSADQVTGKQFVDIPLGFGVIVPKNDMSLTIELARQARSSPFGMRIYKTKLKVPTLSLNISYTQSVRNDTDVMNVPLEFKPLLDHTGGTLLPLDVSTAPEIPTLEAELSDSMNVTHLLFLFKYIAPKPALTQRFPLRLFKRVFILIDIWPYGIMRTENCTLDQTQDGVWCFMEDTPGSGSKNPARGAILKADISLKTTEHIINYFMAMKPNELQAQVIDCESGIAIGSFTLPSAPLLRQQRTSLQFASHTNFIATDGEPLGTFYFSCGSYGTTDHKVITTDFELRYPAQESYAVSRPMYQHDKSFYDMLKSSQEPRFELAAKYREGKKKEIIINDIQKRFLRSKTITPVPGIESRFVFTSEYEATDDMTVIVHINDERLRFIRVLESDDGPDFSSPYKLLMEEGTEFTCTENTPTDEQMHLIKHKGDKFIAREDTKIHLEFSFFTLCEFDNTEISVSLTDERQNLIDCFTVIVKKTVPVVHDNARVALASGESLSITLHTLNNVKMAIASSTIVRCNVTQFGVRISSKPLKHSLRCLVFLYDENGCLVKVNRIHADIMPYELNQIDSELEINISKWMGSRICCKTTDSRVAEFLNHTTPGILAAPGKVTARAHSAGTAQLVIWSISDMSLACQLLLKVGNSNWVADGQRKILSREITLHVGESARLMLRYHNSNNNRMPIRVTTSHPHLITFDPTHYDVGPQETAKIRVIFMANAKVGDVVIHVFVQDTSNTTRPSEFYKFHVHYVDE